MPGVALVLVGVGGSRRLGPPPLLARVEWRKGFDRGKSRSGLRVVGLDGLSLLVGPHGPEA